MSQNSVTADGASDSPDFENRFPRRLLFATAAAGVATAAVATSATPAEAASATTAWLLGGNTGVTTNNFIGPTNDGAALIFKAKNGASAAVTEKMRMTAAGKLGIGTSSPSAKLDVKTGGVAVNGASTDTTAAGRGVVGSAPAGIGVEGKSTDGTGVQGTSTNYIGVNATGGYAGVYAVGTSYSVVGSGGTYGGYFAGSSTGAYCTGVTGVVGSGSSVGVSGSGATGVQGSGPTGVSGSSTDPNGNAVYGSGGQYAVHGVSGRTAGVRGDSNYVGVWAQAPTFALYAEATGTDGGSYGVFSKATGSAYAVFSQGNAHINGTLSKVAGSFKIDHPLDPDNKWLSHSFVESPDMMNIYNGNATTDGGGNATVSLPAYFTALNRDFRYQLTVIGDFAQAVVSKEVANNSFAIKTDKPNVKVSWQVTGIRQDAYAAEHPIVVETAKDPADVGTRQFVAKTSRAKLAQPGPAAQNDSIVPAPAAVPEQPKVQAPPKAAPAPQTDAATP
ncbi:hypothetical protein [Subtercola sp. YIM 133946]|uniref:hypothetical protein n=1 Tax=Subtercola sp. YIM 133946 TaxID=3118909 RepID=UPI002F928359